MPTSKERILAAVNHRLSDRVPLTFDAQPEVYDALYKHLGLTDAGAPRPTAKEDLFDRLHVDTWLIGPQRPAPRPGEPERERGGSIWGYRTRMVRYEGGEYPELVHSPLAGKDEIADIRAHPWPDADALDYSGFRAQAEAHRGRAVIGCFTWGAFFIGTHVRGTEHLLLDFALRRDYAETLINTIAERSLAYLDRLLEAGGDSLDIVYMADDYCSQRAPLFSPADFRHFVMPYLARAAGRVHARGKKFLLHCCGSVRPLMPMLIEAGVDVLEPIQTRAAGMDPAGLKRDFGRDICFYGGVDLQEVLRGPRQGVVDEVKRLIDVLGQGGGYILGPGHTYIQVDAPLENIFAMYDVAVTY